MKLFNSIHTFQLISILLRLDWTKSTNPYKSIHHQHSDLHTSNASSLQLVAKTQNKPKLADSSQNDPKRLWNNKKGPKNWKLGKSGIFYRLFFSKLRAKMPKFGYFGWISVNFLIITIICQQMVISKGINFLILTNFPCILFWRSLFEIWFVFQNFEPKFQNLRILYPKNINWLIVTKFGLHTILEGLISNLTFPFCVS